LFETMRMLLAESFIWILLFESERIDHDWVKIEICL
jgi:hypothetical protein